MVIGRIIYEYEQGGWNEWHLVYNDRSNGWLSDAQLEYDLSCAIQSTTRIACRPDEIKRGNAFQLQRQELSRDILTKAHYKGVQGELPFQYWDKTDLLFADLRNSAGEFATIDYSENPPLLFEGRAVEFDDLHFKNLRLFEGWS